MTGLPSDLLQAISASGGGKVVLVLGAGCSCEAPTGLPLSRQCSSSAHQRLLADNVLAPGECADPDDLSCVADAVFAKTKSQKDLISRILADHSFKSATPNEGYLIGAAFLFEGAVRAVVTLNFDLAMTAALSALGVDTGVAVIDGPHELDQQAGRNVYYLHRNANAPADEWVLRTSVIKTEWKDRWEQHIATSVLTAPVVVFAGLGSPAAVLLESTRLIRAATTNKVVQVDPGDPEKSEFSKALGIGAEAFVKLTWCEFMRFLASRLAEQQLVYLQAAVAKKEQEDSLPPEDVSPLLREAKSLGLVGLGRFRANVLLNGKPYAPDHEQTRGLLADLFQGIAMLARFFGERVKLYQDGVIEFARPGKPSRSFLLASGRGSRGKIAMEVAIKSRLDSLQGHTRLPEGAIVSGTTDWDTPITPPLDIVLDDSSGSIVASLPGSTLIHLGTFRSKLNGTQTVTP
jgi:hypothetical protein